MEIEKDKGYDIGTNTCK